MFGQRARANDVAVAFRVFEAFAAGIDERSHRRDERGEPAVESLEEPLDLGGHVDDAAERLSGQADHEEEIECFTACRQDRFDRLGHSLIRERRFAESRADVLVVALRRELRTPVAYRRVDAADEFGWRRAEELEDDAVVDGAAFQLIEHGVRVRRAAVEQIADEEDRRARNPRELANHRADRGRAAAQRKWPGMKRPNASA